jgi:hypothetical protein
MKGKIFTAPEVQEPIKLELGNFYRHKKTGYGYVCQGKYSGDNYITVLIDYQNRCRVHIGDIFTLKTVFEFISEDVPETYDRMVDSMPKDPSPYKVWRIDSSVALEELN